MPKLDETSKIYVLKCTTLTTGNLSEEQKAQRIGTIIVTAAKNHNELVEYLPAWNGTYEVIGVLLNLNHKGVMIHENERFNGPNCHPVKAADREVVINRDEYIRS